MQAWQVNGDRTIVAMIIVNMIADFSSLWHRPAARRAIVRGRAASHAHSPCGRPPVFMTKVAPQPTEAAPPSNNRMDRNCDRPGWMYREKRETFTDCTWHIYPECCLACCACKDTLDAIVEQNEGVGPCTPTDGGGIAWLLNLPKIWFYTCIQVAPAGASMCPYVCCIYIPYGRFCPGRQWPCLACGPTKGCGPQGCGACEILDAMALSQASVGPGWVALNLSELLDAGEEEEPEAQRYQESQ